MGKVAAATETKKKKKKGRPSLADLQKRNLKQQQENQFQLQQTLVTPPAPNFNSPSRRSTRRNSNLAALSPASESAAGDDSNDEDDDDDERQEKKVKLVVRLPPSNQHYPEPRSSANSQSLNSASNGSDTNADDDNHEGSVKKPKINAGGDRSEDPVAVDQLEKVQKATDTLQGSLLQSDPTTTPLPDKKLLVFILDRLQKKDTYGVFSEPVDPNELPDYFEIVDTPMDFGTVRKKLEVRKYSTLDEFEADVFLICSNAMQYNAPDTVYFRQARSIQELAKRDFANLRQVNDDGEPQPKIVRRGRPPTKNLKKPLGSSPLERVGPESSSDATLATAEENVTGSGSYNLRRAPASLGHRSNDTFYRAAYASRNNETNADWSSDWNSEFPASILRAEAKYGKKQFTVEENRRDTYKQFYPSGFGSGPSVLNSGEAKPLMGVGLQAEHGYARSLARFAANLGPVAWRIASKKIENALPAGVKFGPGWVGENEASSPWPPPTLTEKKPSSQSGHDGVNSIVPNCSSPPIKDAVEALSGHNSNSELSSLKSGFDGANPGFSFQTPQKQMLHPGKNGFSGASGYDQMGILRSRLAMQTGQSGSAEPPVPPQMTGVASRSISSLTSPVAAANHMLPEPKFSGNPTSSSLESIPAEGTAPETLLYGVQQLQEMPSNHKQYSFPVPPDLNVRFQAPVSPSSSARVGSPQQPDLALQL